MQNGPEGQSEDARAYFCDMDTDKVHGTACRGLSPTDTDPVTVGIANRPASPQPP